MFNLAEERPFHPQINIAATIAVLVLVFGRLIRPETGEFGTVSHIASVLPLCICWALLSRTRRDVTFRIFGALSILTCAFACRIFLDKLGAHGDYWRFFAVALILVHAAVLFSRMSDYIVTAVLCGAISFIGLPGGYFTATGHAEFAIATGVSALIGVMLNITIMSAYRKLFEAKEKYRWLSGTDPLTRLLNRRAFMARFAEADEERGKGERCKGALHLAMIDLDHFKQINDRHGHDRGDAVLMAMAQCLQRHAPGLAGRLGGEEFAVLFPDCSRNEAMRQLDMLLREVRGLDIDGVSLTFSAGLVSAEAGENAERVLTRADRALYQAKAAGRNRIVCGETPTLAGENDLRPLPMPPAFAKSRRR
ncbi:MAG: GGDEF domain-containing protein [Rhizobium sp.]|nr:GGDEF domain-containing protein [Rhizobium sp.]